MATYRAITYMILDELQLTSDDALITRDHIVFLMDKYRSYLLKKYYSDVKKTIPEGNYQTICLDLETVNGVDGDECSGTYLRSIQTIPATLGITAPRVSSMGFLGGEITYVSRERMKFVGYNRFLKNITYCCLGPQGKLYLKSSNPQAYYLDRVELSGVFEDSAAAAELSCDNTDSPEGANCDILDKRFPLEEALIPVMIQSIVQELSGTIYRPADDTNNAADDLANKTTWTSSKRINNNTQ